MNLYNTPLLGKWFLMRKALKEGGDKTSITIREYCRRRYNVDVDLYTYGGCFDPHFNVGATNIKIGRYCSFAQDIRYFGANHPIDHAVMSAYFYNSKWSGLPVKDVPRSSLTVGHDVWVGYGTIITSKCTSIGNGAVIAAGSIVTRDVPPYSIVMGSPARVVKYRFDEMTIDLLEESRWFDFTPEELMKFYDLIEKPSEFAKAVIKYRKEEVNGQ